MPGPWLANQEVVNEEPWCIDPSGQPGGCLRGTWQPDASRHSFGVTRTGDIDACTSRHSFGVTRTGDIDASTPGYPFGVSRTGDIDASSVTQRHTKLPVP